MQLIYWIDDTIDADVEVLAVVGISIERVGNEGSSLVAVLNLSRAVKVDNVWTKEFQSKLNCPSFLLI